MTAHGVRLEVTNSEAADFENGRTSVRMTHPDGTALAWTLPDKLLPHLDMQLVTELLGEELDVKRRVRHNTPWLFGDNQPIPYP